jgi:glycosyltransferase involved in cell wall biosynthesis
MASAPPSEVLRASVLVVHNRYRLAGGEDGVVAAETALLTAHGHRVEQLIVDNNDIAEGGGIAGRLRLARETIWSSTSAAMVADRATAMHADVVHIHNFLPQLSPAIHGAARRTGAAVVQTLHNYRLVCPAATLLRDGRPCHDCVGLPIAMPAVVHGCYRGSRAQTGAVAAMLAVHRTRRTWARDVDAFIALTGFAGDQVVAGGVPRSRIHVKPNFTTPPPRDHDEAPVERDGLLFVGRLSEEKGIAVLLDAWRRQPIGTTLRIVGDGPLTEAVQAAASDDPTIVALGRLEPTEVGALMRRSIALVFPSIWYEAMPLTILEAFANGLPVIAFDLGSMRDMIEDGRTGRLCPPGSADALATTMARAVAEPVAMAEMGHAAERDYQATYTAEANIGRLRQVYAAAIAHRQRADPRTDRGRSA